MTAPSSEARRLEELLEDAIMRIGALEEASKAPQLGRSSIDDGFISVRAPDGTTLQQWGVQPDGTSATKSFNKVPPAAPAAPTVTPLPAGLDLAWVGQLVGNMPADFLCVRVHLSLNPDFIPGESNQVGTLYEAGSVIVSDLEYVPYYCKLVAVNLAGATSPASLPAGGTPKKVVADEVLAGIVGELGLAEQAVTAAKLAAAAVTRTKIADGAVETPALAAGSVLAEKIAANAITAGKIAAEAVTARELRALGITADKLAANAVTAAKIAAGAVTADKLTGTLVLGNRIIAGNPNATRVELSASGLLVIKDDEITFQVDASTGDVVSQGEYYTSRYGERLAMNVGGFASPSIRAYPDRGNNYASLFSRSYTNELGNKVAFWGFKVPFLRNPDTVGFVEFVAESASTRTDIVSSKLWYRPYVNANGVVIPGWEAFHQNAAITFSDGWVYTRNAENTAPAPLSTGDIFSSGGVRTGAVFSRSYDGAIRWSTAGNLESVTNNGAAYRGVVASAYGNGPASWRHLKTGFRSLTDYLGESPRQVVDDLDLKAFTYRDDAGPDLAAAGEQIGPMLDDIPEPLIDRRFNEQGQDRSSWELKSMLVVALGALQEVSDEVRELRQEVAALRGAAPP